MEFAPHLRQLFQIRGKAATYTPPSGPVVSCKAIRQGGGSPIMVGPVRVTVERTCFHVLRADIASPAVGAALLVGGETFTVDATQAVERDADALMWSLEVDWGAPILYRSLTGSGTTHNPPTGKDFSLAAAALAGASTITVKADFVVGRVEAGDALTIEGDATVYTVQAPGAAAAGVLIPKIPITPVLAAPAAMNDAVIFAFARDHDVLAAVADYEASEFGGGVQRGDRRLVILQSALDQAGMTDEPKASDIVFLDGRRFNVEKATAIYRGADVIAWDIQARG